MTNNSKNLGRIIKQQRAMRGLTLQQLGEMSGVSSSHLGRIERGERFPSARLLGKIARPLDFSKSELLVFADYLPSQSSTRDTDPSGRRLDPYVATVLAQERVETKRGVVLILSVLKSMASNIAQEKLN
jgi:transcriptional regulator with XRE-family HTH domain